MVKAILNKCLLDGSDHGGLPSYKCKDCRVARSREWRKTRKGIAYSHLYNMQNKDHPGYKAKGEVFKAIRAGKLPKANSLRCKDCGQAAECYDHREYAKPLAVEPVCRMCNCRRGPAIDNIKAK